MKQRVSDHTRATGSHSGISARFQRQIAVEGFGVESQLSLRSSTALVAGIGGLGGTAALYLGAAGIGRLVLCHPGVAEEPDLNRQILLTADQVGESRVINAAEAISLRYPDVEVIAIDVGVASPAVSEWLVNSDVVLDCRHNFAERLELNRMCISAGIPLVEAAMDAAWGYVTVIRGGITPCLECIVGPGDPGWDPLGFPVIGVAAGTIGCLAAAEAIKVLTDWGTALESTMFTLDLADMTGHRFKLSRDTSCLTCSHIPSASLNDSGRRGRSG